MGCGSSKVSAADKKPFNYKKVDKHAKKAPTALRNSAPELVAYLSQVSSEPRMIVRAIFVWISENIAYDTGGRKAMGPYDGESVMRGGSSVCEGYANVMELLCREAGVPVQKISGYAKGHGTSADNPFSTYTHPNHAWNAVQLGGKWFLLDSTWGAGHDDGQNGWLKSFNEFFFLTNPEQFIYSHFPYMDNDMEASNNWQLLKQPISLEEFNDNVAIRPYAFKLGVTPVSHKQGLVRMKNEVTLTFKCDGKDEVEYCTRLMHRQGNMLYEKPRSTFDQIENELFTTSIHPHAAGTFHLMIFGKRSIQFDNRTEILFEYVIQCKQADDADFTFPCTYIQAQIDRCILIAPLQGKLPHNSVVEFHVTSPYLSTVMVNQRRLKRNWMSFKGTVKTGSKGTSLSVYGSRESGFALNRLDGLYTFQVV